MRIAVVYNCDHPLLAQDPGGEARRDVTRVAAAMLEAIETAGHQPVPIPIRSDGLNFVEALRRQSPDAVLNLCESLEGDSRGEIAAASLLERTGLPTTGSSALALGLALHKDQAKELLVRLGIPTPAYVVASTPADLERIALPYPLIVKPVREDASVGVDFGSVVHDRLQLLAAAAEVWTGLRQPALVERFIAGREIYVPLLGNRPLVALPISEMIFGPSFRGRPNIVSYRAKWDRDSAEYQDTNTASCSLEGTVRARVLEAALEAFRAVGCRDYGRVDLRLTPRGEPFVIDVNPNCDLHPEAGFAKAAAAAGIDYPSLALRLVEIALERVHGNPTDHLRRPTRAEVPAGADRELLARRGPLRAGADRAGLHAE